jgi:hypothetical protein
LRTKTFAGIVALGVVLAAAVAPSAGAAPTEPVAVVLVAPFDPIFDSPKGAHGLLVPGEGATVTGEHALASLLRGKMGNAVLNGGKPGGKPLIHLSRHPGRITFYVAVPPLERTHNVTRYGIVVIGPGYNGILTSSSTRLPGLISIADVAPSVRALQRGRKPRIRPQPSADALARLRHLDHRLNQAHKARNGATIVLVGLMTVFGILALVSKLPELGRTAFLSAPACLVVAVALSALGVTDWKQVVIALAGGAGILALVGGALLRPRLPLALGLAAVFAFLFVVMWKRPEWNSLAALGPRPDGGGRFYGVTNQVETLLLAPALVLGALVGPALPAVALLIAAGIAASSVGADGGGLVVYLAGFLVLALRLGTRPGVTRVAVATVIAAAAALALVGIDAATGGSSHVTHAVGGGPGSLAGDLGHRLHLSWASIGSTWNAALLFALGLAALIWLAFRRPRLPILDALIVALAVSLIVNDTPTDVAGLGGLSALVLWAWWRSGERLRGLD